MCNCVKETEHITPVLMTLHSLPITVSVNFKILHVTFKALHGLALEYILKLLFPYQPGHRYKPVNYSHLKLDKKAIDCLPIRPPQLWNDLPEEIWLASPVSSFKSLVLSHLDHKAVFLFSFLWFFVKS